MDGRGLSVERLEALVSRRGRGYKGALTHDMDQSCCTDCLALERVSMVASAGIGVLRVLGRFVGD
jgi:hypothetical protein